MIYQSIKMGIRRLAKFKVYSLINIVGLGIAVSVCLIILLYAHFHFSFDKYVNKSKNSYRIISRLGDGTYNPNTFACIENVLSDCAGVESFTGCYISHNISEVFVGANSIKVNEALFANKSFLDYFSVKMIKGDKSSIDQPNTMFVIPQMANKLFPNQEAIGKTVLFRSFTNNQDSMIAYTITGIIEPLPQSSHIGYEMLLSQKGHFGPTIEHVKAAKVFAAAVYVKLFPSVVPIDLEKTIIPKLEPFLNGKPGPPLEAFNLHLQPLRTIHFTTDTMMEMKPTVRKSSLQILLLVGFLLFIIATINFVNMHLARAAFHQKDSGIIRFLGGSNRHLFGTVFSEAFVSITISFVLAIALLVLFKISLAGNFFANWAISIQGTTFWVITFGLFLFVLFVVSLLSTFNLSKATLISKQTISSRRFPAAKPLVVFQFVLVIALIAFTLLINLQMNYVNHKSLGYTSQNVLVISAPQTNAKVNTLREELLKLPGIVSAATVQHYPGYHLQDMTFANGENVIPFKFGFIDQYAIQTLNIKPVKYFTDARENAFDGWLINETFYNQLKSKFTDEQIKTGDYPQDESQPIDKSRQKFVVIGVISDFHYASLHDKIENFAFYVRNPETQFNRFVLARFEQNKTSTVVKSVENTMAEIYPDQPIKYDFLDNQLQEQYRSEQTLLRLINSFSVLAILVACLGLIGLSIFVTEQRTKEIGIRIVNGAKVSEIMGMLNNDYLKLIVVAFFIGSPIGYFAMQKWLQSFAYRTEISWWIFAFSGIMALGIALLTVSWQSWKAATRNPVEALRYE